MPSVHRRCLDRCQLPGLSVEAGTGDARRRPTVVDYWLPSRRRRAVQPILVSIS